MISVKAKLTLYTNKGRKTPVVSGYRPLFNFVGANTKISGRIDLLEENVFMPGESGIVKITFLQGIIADNYFVSGVRFTFDEGQQILGEGEIVNI